MEIQEVNTLIFEIQVRPSRPPFSSFVIDADGVQELRHATSMSASTSKNGASGAGGTESVSEVDAALMRLEAKLEAVRGVRPLSFLLDYLFPR